MKKIASIVVLGIGLTLVGLNYYGELIQNGQNGTVSSKGLETTEQVALNKEEPSQEPAKINIPSIFNALLRLL